MAPLSQAPRHGTGGGGHLPVGLEGDPGLGRGVVPEPEGTARESPNRAFLRSETISGQNGEIIFSLHFHDQY